MKISRKKKVDVVQVDDSENVDLGAFQYEEKCRRFYEVKRQKGILEKEEAELKKDLDAYVDLTPADTKGNRYFYSTDYAGNRIILEREARKKVSFNEERAIAFFKRRKLLDLVYKTKEVKYFDEEEINNLYQCGDITAEELQSITDVTTTYATKFIKNVGE